MYSIEMTEILEQVQFTLCDHLRVPPWKIAASTTFDDDLHIDDDDLAEVCGELETLFEIEIDPMRGFRTVFDLAAFVGRHSPFAMRDAA